MCYHSSLNTFMYSLGSILMTKEEYNTFSSISFSFFVIFLKEDVW